MSGRVRTSAETVRCVRVRRPGEDAVPWLRVALVAVPLAVLGWSIPRACSLRGGAEGTEETVNVTSSAEPASSVVVGAGEPSSAPQDAASAEVPEVPTYSAVSVGKPALMHCQDQGGPDLKASKCGEHGLDALIVPQLEALSRCPATSTVLGKLALTVDLNFATRAVRVVASKGSSVSRAGRPDNRAIEPVLQCLRASLKDVLQADTGNAREHARWVFSVPVTLGQAVSNAVPSAAVPEKATTGTAVVQVDTAIVREGPSTSGAPIGRLARGSRVTTFGVSGNWYHIHFGEGGTQDGWIYRSSIGR